MRADVLEILRSATKKLRATRAAEAAAVVAVAAGLCAAVGELAWIVAWPHPVVGTVLCGLAVVAGVAVFVSPRLRGVLTLAQPASGVAAGVCILAGAAGAVLVLTGRHLDIPHFALPLVLIPLGGGAGALSVRLAGISLRRTAIYLDARGGLGERMSTAAELAESAQRDEPFARCVYDQALAAVREKTPHRRPMWKRGAPTAGALVLVMLLCAALSLVSASGPLEVTAGLRSAADGLKTMPPDRKARLAEALRQAAEQLPNDPELVDKLLAGAKAVEIADDERLREIVAELERRLRESGRTISGRAAEKLLAAADAATGGGGPGGEGPGPGGGAATRRPPRTRPAGGGPPSGDGGELVHVYHPDYEKIARRPGAGGDGEGSGADGAGAFLDRDRAWALARARAGSALAAGNVPATYRRLVRDFFETEP